MDAVARSVATTTLKATQATLQVRMQDMPCGLSEKAALSISIILRVRPRLERGRAVRLGLLFGLLLEDVHRHKRIGLFASALRMIGPVHKVGLI